MKNKNAPLNAAVIENKIFVFDFSVIVVTPSNKE